MSDTPLQVYHNPRCSKSRRTVEILTERGVPFELYHYLDENPDADALRRVIAALGIDDPRKMMRTKESEYAEEGLAERNGDALIAAMVQHPKLIERPIVIQGDRAVIARPPEHVFELIGSPDA